MGLIVAHDVGAGPNGSEKFKRAMAHDVKKFRFKSSLVQIFSFLSLVEGPENITKNKLLLLTKSNRKFHGIFYWLFGNPYYIDDAFIDSIIKLTHSSFELTHHFATSLNIYPINVSFSSKNTFSASFRLCAQLCYVFLFRRNTVFFSHGFSIFLQRLKAFFIVGHSLNLFHKKNLLNRTYQLW